MRVSVDAQTGEEKIELKVAESTLLLRCHNLCLILSRHTTGGVRGLSQQAAANLHEILDGFDLLPPSSQVEIDEAEAIKAGMPY